VDVEEIARLVEGDAAAARKAIELGFNLGLRGPSPTGVPRKGISSPRFPLKALLLETDAPGSARRLGARQRNDSTRLKTVVDMISAVKGVTDMEVVQATTANAQDSFRDWPYPGRKREV
jgi:TatD DNase family protein